MIRLFVDEIRLPMRVCLVIFLCSFFTVSLSQVTNNSIEQKITLKLDDTMFNSTTANSSVQWSCVNKVLTDKCVIHHNDQWFDFSVVKKGTYYLNVYSQECRDKRGIQVIVIEGDPCKVVTYKILKCISKVRLEDVFIKLDSLKPGISYLVNIDGFLADQCNFGIQLSKTPLGLPLYAEKPDSVIAAGRQGDSIFHLAWHLRREKVDDIQSFHVYRTRGYSRSIIVDEQQIRRNAFGLSFQDYESIDTLHEEGDYKYFVYGIQKETRMPHLLVEKGVRYEKKLPNVVRSTEVVLNLSYPEKMSFQILIYDLKTDAMLRSSKHEFESLKDKKFKIDLKEFLDKGVNQFLILASNDKQALEFYFIMTSKGFVQN